MNYRAYSTPRWLTGRGQRFLQGPQSRASLHLSWPGIHSKLQGVAIKIGLWLGCRNPCVRTLSALGSEVDGVDLQRRWHESWDSDDRTGSIIRPRRYPSVTVSPEYDQHNLKRHKLQNLTASPPPTPPPRACQPLPPTNASAHNRTPSLPSHSSEESRSPRSRTVPPSCHRNASR